MRLAKPLIPSPTPLSRPFESRGRREAPRALKERERPGRTSRDVEKREPETARAFVREADFSVFLRKACLRPWMD